MWAPYVMPILVHSVNVSSLSPCNRGEDQSCLVHILLNVYIVHVGLLTDCDCGGSVAIFGNVCYVYAGCI